MKLDGYDSQRRLLWPLRELRLSIQFIRRDIATTLIPSFIFTVVAVKYAWPLSGLELLCVLGRWGLYFWLYIYTFCLANQIAGVDEDRINKPTRPYVF
jgi:4-hydroxybenzoate polyprenyltransferase